jgi:SAM-dependent methyltransferase
MGSQFFTQVYDSWLSIQLDKYQQLLPILSQHLSHDFSVLDLGVGKAWFHSFLRENGFTFKKIVGVDVSEEAIFPRQDFIDYQLTDSFTSKEKFDFVVCFDSLHLLENQNVLEHLKPGGLALLALPRRWQSLFEPFSQEKILASGIIGSKERDEFLLIQK